MDIKTQNLIDKLDILGPFCRNQDLARIIAQADKAGIKHPQIDFARGVLVARIVG